MKIEKVLEKLNSFEKNSFLKVIDQIINPEAKPKYLQQINQVLSDSSTDLKSADNSNIAKIFELVTDEFETVIKLEFSNIDSQFDVLCDILIRDGNCIMKQEWFAQLYHAELKKLNMKIKAFKRMIDEESYEIDRNRRRDYIIYRECLKTAYYNDLEHNLSAKISRDEQTILLTLAKQLELSKEEIKLINYQIIKPEILDIDKIINNLKNIGIIFYSKKNNIVYIADEVVRILRKVRGKEVADKFFRRLLLSLRVPQINMICNKHNIDRKLSHYDKINAIINEGISFSTVLIIDIYKEGTKVSEKKKILNEICEKGLSISNVKGITLEDKIAFLIQYFEDIERDEKVSISFDGYEKLLVDILKFLPKTNDIVKKEFELQDEHVLSSSYLLDYNIKPRDVIEILEDGDLLKFCEANNIKIRGDKVSNILDKYKDAENLNLENYENIGFRNLSILKENGILIKEADLGVKFEQLTKLIFSKLGFDVDESLRKKINTKKEKVDIVLKLNEQEVILVECKTVKESGYNKFSSVSRQMKSYISLITSNDLKVVKSLLVAPDFSDEFINDCELEYDLNLSLIKASSLKRILDAFKVSKLKTFSYKLLLRDVLIQEERIIKAITK